MDEFIAVYLYDVKRAIEEVESYFIGYPMRYDVFEKDYLRRSAVERKAEIMGEAINRILKIQRDFPLPNARTIIDTRNRIIHGYDSVKPEFLWSLVIRHIPNLKKDLEQIISEYGISTDSEGSQTSD
ncbi:DUF86 domain-containing protein [Bacteroides ovatus]|uniref:HepT-like ribonuclease domain-containing protein n=1 Tax=Bacteroides ovatus TaxID=28116 RepID=UPI001F44F875|nr:HepT-like ribonuclease domain-containing protein [Bacteroides ovatus]MCE8924929.1 DUF86 domain-containing protein [Bacteroides ovatus]